MKEDFYKIKLSAELYNFLEENSIKFNPDLVKLNDSIIIYKDAILEPNLAFLSKDIKLQTMGFFSYTNSSLENGISIGRYCSIGKNVKVLNKHFNNGISTSPLFYQNQDILTNIKIANDVRIGDNVSLVKELKIGNGAIITDNSMVAEDVPEFAIVAGVPAKVIRYRFKPEFINKIKTLQWWNYNLNELKELQADNPELFLNNLEQRIKDNLIQPYNPELINTKKILSFSKFYNLISLLPKYDNLEFSQDFSNSLFYQIYIKGLDRKIHYEVIETQGEFFLTLDFEQYTAQNAKYKTLVQELCKNNANYKAIILEHKLSIRITINPEMLVDKFKELYNQTIDFLAI